MHKGWWLGILLTGTRNNTPVIIDVNAVPPPTRDQMFPQRPMTIAPKAEMIVT